jgi:hypothetical protein
MIHLPQHVRLVCLSATVSNVDELAEWITTVRGPTAPIVERRRPVRLDNEYLVADRDQRSAADAARVRRRAPQPRRRPARRVGGARRRPGDASSNRRGATARLVGFRSSASSRRRPRRDRRAARTTATAPGDLLHLQPGAVRRGRQVVRRCRARPHDRPSGRDPAIVDERLAGSTTPTSRCSATTQFVRNSSAASPPTTPAWCRR